MAVDDKWAPLERADEIATARWTRSRTGASRGTSRSRYAGERSATLDTAQRATEDELALNETGLARPPSAKTHLSLNVLYAIQALISLLVARSGSKRLHRGRQGGRGGCLAIRLALPLALAHLRRRPARRRLGRRAGAGWRRRRFVLLVAVVVLCCRQARPRQTSLARVDAAGVVVVGDEAAMLLPRGQSSGFCSAVFALLCLLCRCSALLCRPVLCCSCLLISSRPKLALALDTVSSSQG